MYQAPLESQLKVIQHITECAPVYAKHLSLDDPSLVTNLSSTPADVDTVFYFNDKDWVVSKNEGCRQQSLTHRYISNTSYFAEDNICTDLLIAKWDEIFSRQHKKPTTNRGISYERS